MQTPEDKVANSIVELTESQWFNPAVFGRVLANQPFYTSDRIMEMIVHAIKQLSIRHDQESVHGKSSHGLMLANELHSAITAIRELSTFDNLTLPTSNKTYTRNLSTPAKEYKFGWKDGDTPSLESEELVR
jgi:hypothetical protein